MVQIEFIIPDGEHSTEIGKEAAYQSALGTLRWYHRFTGWIWDGTGLKTKEGSPEDVNCHSELFGDIVHHCPYRGWFNPERKVITVQACRLSSQEPLEGADQLPETLYRHLIRKFGEGCLFIV